MKPLFICLLTVLFVFCGCDVNNRNPNKTPHKITYSYACLDSSVSGSETSKAISKTTGVIRDLAVSKKEITDSVQNAYGDAFHKDAIESKTVVLLDDPAVHAQLQNILNDLLAARENPSKIAYSI